MPWRPPPEKAMMLPRPLRSYEVCAAWHRCMKPYRFTSIARFHSSRSVSQNRPIGPWMPAASTSTSILPYRSSAVRTTRSASRQFETSAWTAQASTSNAFVSCDHFPPAQRSCAPRERDSRPAWPVLAPLRHRSPDRRRPRHTTDPGASCFIASRNSAAFEALAAFYVRRGPGDKVALICETRRQRSPPVPVPDDCTLRHSSTTPPDFSSRQRDVAA